MSLLLLAAVLAADPPAAGHRVADDAVVPPGAKLVVVRAKDGGVEALDPATGKPLWANTDADRPAGASDTFVLAWAADPKKANTFRVAVIDAATGKTVTTSDPIALPDWATTAKTWGRTFRAAARVDGDAAVVGWWAGAFYAGGARPTPEVEAAARKAAAGVAVVDLKTGKVTAKDGEPKAADFGAVGPKVGGLEFRFAEQVPGFKPGGPRVTAVTLTALKDGKELWKRELAGNPWSPPPP
ncbi:MAG: hypothetical protein C0501_14820 [Isosphaera sp.]|nr:hypothetical protein [Isosphaera sp.]